MTNAEWFAAQFANWIGGFLLDLGQGRGKVDTFMGTYYEALKEVLEVRGYCEARVDTSWGPARPLSDHLKTHGLLSVLSPLPAFEAKLSTTDGISVTLLRSGETFLLHPSATPNSIPVFPKFEPAWVEDVKHEYIDQLISRGDDGLDGFESWRKQCVSSPRPVGQVAALAAGLAAIITNYSRPFSSPQSDLIVAKGRGALERLAVIADSMAETFRGEEIGWRLKALGVQCRAQATAPSLDQPGKNDVREDLHL